MIRHLRKLMLMLSLTVFFPAVAVGQETDMRSGQYVHTSCELGKKSVPHEAFCIGFLIGTVDALFRSGAICDRPNVDRNEAYEVVRNFLRDHPEDRQSPAVTLAAIALIEAFPCQ